MEISNLLGAELKMLVIRILKNISENFNKVIGNIKMEMKNINKNQ